MKVGTNMFIPYNAVADSAIIGFETRTGASTSHTIGLLSTIVERFGREKSKVTLSYSTTYRSRIATVKKYAEAIQEAWICLSPETTHWDGKVMKDLQDQYQQEDMSPILISGNNTHKFLGGQALPIKRHKI